MNSLPKVKLGQVGVGVGANISKKINCLASGKSYLVIIGPNLPDKFKLYQVGVDSNIAQNHTSNISNLSGVICGFNSNLP